MKKDPITHDIDANGHIIPGSPLDLRIRNLEAEVERLRSLEVESERLRGKQKYLLSSLYGRVEGGYYADTNKAELVKGHTGGVKYYDISSSYPESMRRGFAKPLYKYPFMTFLSVQSLQQYCARGLSNGHCVFLAEPNSGRRCVYILDRCSNEPMDGFDILSVFNEEGRWRRMANVDGSDYDGGST